MFGAPTTLMFAKQDCIFSYNFEKEEVKIEYEMKIKFDMQPDFFNTDDTQNLMFISNEKDSIWINVIEKMEIDMD